MSDNQIDCLGCNKKFKSSSILKHLSHKPFCKAKYSEAQINEITNLSQSVALEALTPMRGCVNRATWPKRFQKTLRIFSYFLIILCFKIGRKMIMNKTRPSTLERILSTGKNNQSNHVVKCCKGSLMTFTKQEEK